MFISGIKGIVSQDFHGLQMILIDRAWVPGFLLDVKFFLNSCFHIIFSVQSFE